MAYNLHRWRTGKGLTQVEAAQMLGVSQTYLSLLEKGARPLTAGLARRWKSLRGPQTARRASVDEELRSDLADLGYPGFSHLRAERRRPDPGLVLLAALRQSDLDARVTEALPWTAAKYADKIDWNRMVRQAKLSDLQNRLGYLLEMSMPVLAGSETADSALMARMRQARSDLDKARLLQEVTFCWDSMPERTRRWMRVNRSPAAAHWNIVTRMHVEDLVAE